MVNFLKLGPILDFFVGLSCLHIFHCVFFKVGLGDFFLVMENPCILKVRSLTNLLHQFLQNKSHKQVVLNLEHLKIHITHNAAETCSFLYEGVAVLVNHLGVHFLNWMFDFVILALEVVQLTNYQAVAITDLSVIEIKGLYLQYFLSVA